MRGLAYVSREVDEALAGEIREFRSPTDGETRMFYEIVVAPGYTLEGLAKLKGKSKTLRILEATPRAPAGRSLRQIAGACPQCAPCAWEPQRSILKSWSPGLARGESMRRPAAPFGRSM